MLMLPTSIFLLSLPLLGTCSIIITAIRVLTCFTWNAAAVTTVTLYDVVPTSTDPAALPASIFPTPFVTYSVAGVGSDGLTTYVQEIRESQYVELDLSVSVSSESGSLKLSTVTSFSTVAYPTPSTYYATLAEGASEIKYFISPSERPAPVGQESDRHWDDDGEGECEIKGWYAFQPESTWTNTYTGAVMPFYTLVVESDVPSQDTDSGTSGAARHAVLGVLMSVFVIMSTVIFIA